jgi:glyceraldehyde-3-phosphate dehydrogenase (NADP+)
VLLDHVTPDMRIAWEEPFGPVVPIMRVPSEEAAVQHCNSSNFGLQGCVFTRNINAAMRISDAMRTGTVQVGVGVFRHRVKARGTVVVGGRVRSEACPQ